MTEEIRTEGAESAAETSTAEIGEETTVTLAEEVPAEEAAPAAASEPVSEPAAPEPAPIESQADLMQSSEDYTRAFPSLNEGDVVQGTVVHIDREGVLVDVGTKSEGIIRRSELSRDTSIPAEDIVKVGEKISVYVRSEERRVGKECRL